MADDSELTESDIWASPNQNAHSEPRPKTPKTPKTPRTPKTPKTPAAHDRQPEPIDHEAALRKELEGVRGINEALEGVIGTLERAGGNMGAVFQTVKDASVLLNTWTRILSQTEHNQRLILHPTWKGATEDLAEQESEALRKQQAAERRAAEEEQRREAARQRREEEEERRRLGASTPGTRGSRGISGARGGRVRGRATSRGGAGSGYLSENNTSGASSSRGTSGIGRGLGSIRGRSRAAR